MKLGLLLKVSRIIQRISSLGCFFAYKAYRCKYALSDSFVFNGNNIQFYGDGAIVTGKNSYIGELSTIQAAPGCSVKIGAGCKISHNVRIYTQSALADADFSIEPVPEKFGDVTIQDFCWIGANVFMNPGVTIGENSVVGANSVVTTNIPAGEIWGGVPARFIRKKIALLS